MGDPGPAQPVGLKWPVFGMDDKTCEESEWGDFIGPSGIYYVACDMGRELRLLAPKQCATLVLQP